MPWTFELAEPGCPDPAGEIHWSLKEVRVRTSSSGTRRTYPGPRLDHLGCGRQEVQQSEVENIKPLVSYAAGVDYGAPPGLEPRTADEERFSKSAGRHRHSIGRRIGWSGCARVSEPLGSGFVSYAHGRRSELLGATAQPRRHRNHPVTADPSADGFSSGSRVILLVNGALPGNRNDNDQDPNRSLAAG